MKKAALVLFLFGLSLHPLEAGDVHRAAAAGDVELLKSLLGADDTLLESRDDNRMTPLHHAIAEKRRKPATRKASGARKAGPARRRQAVKQA